MALYTSDSRDRVRDAVDFVELVSARTELRRAGPTRYEGLCPFHDERTPSFGIDPHQKVYYCFGCQASGDLFTFVQETESVDFRGALELLAERYGIELQREQEDPREAQERRRKERLLGLIARTSSYYERVLWESTEAAGAREYLKARGLTEQALRRHGVGYAPSAWDKVLSASLRSGYSEQELLAAGLAQRSRENGRPYDRFRRRVMFPLADIRGRVLGFGARAIGEDQGPKYLNSSDNDIYHKGEHLYGAHLARPEAAKLGKVILCEGYTDVIALHEAGMLNAVGLMGTALTGRQLAEIGRMASTLLLALDSDTAGQEAMLKAARLAADRRLELRVVEMPGGMDPAELIQREGPDAMRAAIDASVPFVRFRVTRALSSGDVGSPEGRDAILEEVRPIFATLQEGALRDDLARIVADRLSLSERVLEDLLGAAGRTGGGAVGPGAPGAPGGPRGLGASQSAGGAEGSREERGQRGTGARGALGRRQHTERAFLALCIASPDLGAAALARILPEEHFTEALLRRVAIHLRDGALADPLSGVDEEDLEMRRALAELIVEAGAGGASEAMLEVSRLQLELSRIERSMKAARSAGSGEGVTALAKRRGEVKRELDAAQERALAEG